MEPFIRWLWFKGFNLGVGVKEELISWDYWSVFWEKRRKRKKKEKSNSFVLLPPLLPAPPTSLSSCSCCATDAAPLPPSTPVGHSASSRVSAPTSLVFTSAGVSYCNIWICTLGCESRIGFGCIWAYLQGKGLTTVVCVWCDGYCYHIYWNGGFTGMVGYWVTGLMVMVFNEWWLLCLLERWLKNLLP